MVLNAPLCDKAVPTGVTKQFHAEIKSRNFRQS